SFHPKCRNAIRKALKSGVEITPATDPELLDQFHNSYAAMCKRKGAPMIEKKSVVDGMKRLIEKNHVLLFVERYAGQISNMVLVDTLGLPCYMLGTRTAASVEGKVPSHAQAVLYEVMRYLRDQRKIYYDLGGCEGPRPVQGHPNYGVWRFKYGFRGTYVEFLPYFRKARGPITRCLLNLAHRVRGDYM
ncbi:MAG: hypothetical protein KAV00_14380, partial [Phycisphaerae bacterium]|nr:hypothetical protein [Phycisphaerae bacterium]